MTFTHKFIESMYPLSNGKYLIAYSCQTVMVQYDCKLFENGKLEQKKMFTGFVIASTKRG
jgi:hypothetical protein